MVIKKLLQLIDLNELINIVICPTLREHDGLAMSSRNMRLTSDERKKAIAIPAALLFIKNNLVPDNLSTLKTEATAMLTKSEFRVDYIEITDAETLQTVTQWDGHQKIVALAAAYINDVRLIDNLSLN
jgi:pantoate--beta-alanine ligase